VQEFDEMLDDDVPNDDIVWDYLRSPSGKAVGGREVDGATETDHLRFMDYQATMKDEVRPGTGFKIRPRIFKVFRKSELNDEIRWRMWKIRLQNRERFYRRHPAKA